VALIEIPTKGEIHDNVVNFWRPKEPLRAGGEYLYTYRLHWCWDSPMQTDLGRFVKFRTGAGNVPNSRLFVLDIVGGKLGNLPAEVALTAQVNNSAGRIVYPVLQPNPDLGGFRLSFNMVPERASAVELRAQIFRDAEPMSEVWTFRWTP
jgi:glucans biosynthesis protein